MSKAILVWQSIMAGLQVLAGIATLGDLIGMKAAGFIIIAVAVLQAATATYVHGVATPTPAAWQGPTK